MWITTALLFACSTPSAPQHGALAWTSTDSGTNASLRGLCAVSRDVCWASGAGGTVLRTVDGATWERRDIPGAEAFDFRDVHAFDAQRAIVLGAGLRDAASRLTDGAGADRLSRRVIDPVVSAIRDESTEPRHFHWPSGIEVVVTAHLVSLSRKPGEPNDA